MTLKEWWSALTVEGTNVNSYFSIPVERVQKTEGWDPGARFIPRNSYFEVRLKQMFLQNKREYFREFEPVVSSAIEFQFAGKRLRVPMVIGPTSMSDANKISNGDCIEYLNTRLIGPCPYEGEDLEVFIGLFRLVSTDWSKRALSLLETIGKTFDASRLTSFLNISEPVTNGVQNFLGMKDLEIRLGECAHYAAPAQTSPQNGALRPCYEALVRCPRGQLSQTRFWVNEGRLFCGETSEKIREFVDADFLLLQISPLATRDDYTGFEFHQRHWKKIEQLLAEQKNDDAIEAFKLLAASLVQCDDIIYPHRVALLKRYREAIDEAIALYGGLYAHQQSPARGTLRGKPRTRVELDETTLKAAALKAVNEQSYSPEALMAKFTNS